MLVLFKQYLLHVRYGSYLNGRCPSLGKDLVQKYAKIKSYWTEMGQIIKSQRELWRRGHSVWSSDPPPEAHQVRELILLWKSASDLGFERDYTERMIVGYAERNKVIHASIDEVIREGHYHELSSALYHDYRDVALVLPETAVEDVQRVRQVIRYLRDEHLQGVDFPEDEDRLQSWSRSDKARDLRHRLLHDWEAARAAMVRDVVKGAGRYSENMATRKSLFEEAIAGSDRKKVVVGMKEHKWKMVTNLREEAQRKREELVRLNALIEEMVRSFALEDMSMQKTDKDREHDELWNELDRA